MLQISYIAIMAENINDSGTVQVGAIEIPYKFEFERGELT
jgi:hypothetical protein